MLIKSESINLKQQQQQADISLYLCSFKPPTNIYGEVVFNYGICLDFI
jgi:hypothetical protein